MKGLMGQKNVNSVIMGKDDQIMVKRYTLPNYEFDKLSCEFVPKMSRYYLINGRGVINFYVNWSKNVQIWPHKW